MAVPKLKDDPAVQELVRVAVAKACKAHRAALKQKVTAMLKAHTDSRKLSGDKAAAAALKVLGQEVADAFKTHLSEAEAA